MKATVVFHSVFGGNYRKLSLTFILRDPFHWQQVRESNAGLGFSSIFLSFLEFSALHIWLFHKGKGESYQGMEGSWPNNLKAKKIRRTTETTAFSIDPFLPDWLVWRIKRRHGHHNQKNFDLSWRTRLPSWKHVSVYGRKKKAHFIACFGDHGLKNGAAHKEFYVRKRVEWWGCGKNEQTTGDCYPNLCIMGDDTRKSVTGEV